MVVKSTPTGRTPLKSSDVNRPRERPLKPKAVKTNLSKIKDITKFSSSPTKTPLTSSSLANIKRSPGKSSSSDPQRTPEKLSLLQQTPKKESFYMKVSPCSFSSNSHLERNNVPFGTNSSVFSTPSSEPPSSCSSSFSLSPNSPLCVKEENVVDPHDTRGGAGVDTSSGSISEGFVNSNSGDSCRNHVASATLHGSVVVNNPHGPPVSRRNARERNRVKQVSLGFALLRQHVPQANRKKKLSKVETLRCAVEYIRNLQLLLQENPNPHLPPTSNPSNLPHKMGPAHIYPATRGNPSSESFLQHLQVTNPQLISSDASAQTSGPGVFAVHRVTHIPCSSYQPRQTNHYLDDRLQQHMTNSTGSDGSCLEPHILKVPKMDGHFQSTTPYNSSSIFTLPSVSFVKSEVLPLVSSPTNIDGAPTPPQDTKDMVLQGMPEICNYTGLNQPKDTGDVDLMEALAWWQQNS